MYVADSRFAANYEKVEPGLTAYVRDAIVANGCAISTARISPNDGGGSAWVPGRIRTVGSPQTLSEADRRIVAGWAADCAERVLWLFEAEAPGDTRPHDAIARTRAFSRGELDVAEEIRLASSEAPPRARMPVRQRRLTRKRPGRPQPLPTWARTPWVSPRTPPRRLAPLAPTLQRLSPTRSDGSSRICRRRPDPRSASSQQSVKMGPDPSDQDCSHRACLARSSAIPRPAWPAPNADNRL